MGGLVGQWSRGRKVQKTALGKNGGKGGGSVLGRGEGGLVATYLQRVVVMEYD